MNVVTPVALDPAALGDEPAVNCLRFTRRPRHLLDRTRTNEQAGSGLMLFGLPSSSSTAVPSFFSSGTAGSRALIEAAGHRSPVGAKIYWCLGMKA